MSLRPNRSAEERVNALHGSLMYGSGLDHSPHSKRPVIVYTKDHYPDELQELAEQRGHEGALGVEIRLGEAKLGAGITQQDDEFDWLYWMYSF